MLSAASALDVHLWGRCLKPIRSETRLYRCPQHTFFRKRVRVDHSQEYPLETGGRGRPLRHARLPVEFERGPHRPEILLPGLERWLYPIAVLRDPLRRHDYRTGRGPTLLGDNKVVAYIAHSRHLIGCCEAVHLSREALPFERGLQRIDLVPVRIVCDIACVKCR